MPQKTYDRQTAKFLGVVGENMPELSGDAMQRWIQNTMGLQEALKAALCQATIDLDYFSFMNREVVIQIPALKRPTLAELQKRWSFIHSIERDGSTEGPVTLRLSTVLKPGESSIPDSVYEHRLDPLRRTNRLLGFQHRQWLLAKQKAHPAFMALLGKIYIDFPGIVVVDDVGNRGVPCVLLDGAQFVGAWDWLDDDFDGIGRIAVSSKPA